MATGTQTRDYSIVLDKSGSMENPASNGKSRWEVAQESIQALANKVAKLDPDGIDVYVFSSRFRYYQNTTPETVARIFQENEPMGSTDLYSVLKAATDNFLDEKRSGGVKGSGETIFVLTDGEPDDRGSVMRLIVEVTRQMEKLGCADEELAIQFIQVGSDSTATRFLKALDDELVGAGAKFDIVNTMTHDEMGDRTIAEILEEAISD